MTRARKKLPGTVTKIVEPKFSSEPEKAEIQIEEAEDLYREIRIENNLTTDSGTEVRLKPGEKVEVQVEITDEQTRKGKA